MKMDLGEISQLCYNMTTSYLQWSNTSEIISETQDAINLTREYFLRDIFTKWDPLSNQISFSFNGGKDCQVLLLLYLSCLWEFFFTSVQNSQFDSQYQRFPLSNISGVLISQEAVFPSIQTFIDYGVDRYHLDMYESLPSDGKQTSMADAFQTYLDLYPNIQAIIIGVRNTDPYGDTLKLIQSTDSGWPLFDRVQPILHWKLAHIWSFILYSGEKICGLYANGYTSIGDINGTFPNPHLITNGTDPLPLFFNAEIENSFGMCSNNDTQNVNILPLDEEDRISISSFDNIYYPGWYLIEDSLEREGRVKKFKT